MSNIGCREIPKSTVMYDDKLIKKDLDMCKFVKIEKITKTLITFYHFQHHKTL